MRYEPLLTTPAVEGGNLQKSLKAGWLERRLENARLTMAAINKPSPAQPAEPITVSDVLLHEALKADEAASAGAEKGAGKAKKTCVDCRDYEENIKGWIEQLGGNPETSYLSLELERLIDALTPLPSSVGDASTPKAGAQETQEKQALWIIATMQPLEEGNYSLLSSAMRQIAKEALTSEPFSAPAAPPVSEGELPAMDDLGESVDAAFNGNTEDEANALFQLYVRERQLRAAIGRAEKAEAELRDVVSEVDAWEAREQDATKTSRYETFEDLIGGLRESIEEMMDYADCLGEFPAPKDGSGGLIYEYHPANEFFDSALKTVISLRSQAKAAEAELTTLKQAAEEMADLVRKARKVHPLCIGAYTVEGDGSLERYGDARCEVCRILDAALSKYEAVNK